MTDLGVLPGHCFSGAGGINANTQVVGASFPCDSSLPHAFLWESGGPMVDLNDLVVGADMTLTGSQSINDRGEITSGLGVLPNGDLHVYLLIPCDEHHPGIKGCDYSMVDATAATGVITPRPVRNSQVAVTSMTRFRSMSNPMLRRFGGR
jgi:probable HAF family extracellular repeat protein